jgi:hypothetical protein
MICKITFNNKTQSLTAWAKEQKLPLASVVARLKRGWSIERALTTKNRAPRDRNGSKNSNYKHGGAVGGISKEYYIWADMKRRCLNPEHPQYKNYGGRGIKVCNEWIKSFAAWHSYIGPRPSPKHSQDRSDNEGHYEPGNVCWVTAREQQRNKRNTRFVTAQGQTLALCQWAEKLRCPISSLHWRLSSGWSEEKTITTPFRKVRKPCSSV